ncbi:DNA polymerase III subunit delta' [Sediminibacillus dalangtanensis]|uniref:DNA polymerase III subunit delta n=1 Tax=Sediminibacillus dalangtanensis TaxID=2729421 RepID=A0ABX7VW88_9BACI|nr:DNA polymerase III subunit delta' [Sediminibacillus dalangtanensis]QTN01238.1 DNA polymerase III subunit delta' [Sediminibacillus dalangtanensis]
MKTWSDIASIQPLVARMLTNSLAKQRVSHAYLFQGNRGTGKKAISMVLAKSIFCRHKNGQEPCQQCKDCQRIESGNHPDVHWIIPDGHSIKKEQILHLQKEFTYTGLESNQKVYIIEDAEKMTANASNRLLKFLEEPSKQTTAMLLTSNSQAILQTIRSRCQIMALKPLNAANLQRQLQEEGLSSSNARLISALTNNITEALEIGHDDWFANARKIVVQLTEVLQSKPEEAMLFINNQWMPHFKERQQMQRGLDLLLLWFKDIVYSFVDNEEAIIFINEKDKLSQASLHWSKQETTDALQRILEAKRKLEQNVHPALAMEQLTLHLKR